MLGPSIIIIEPHGRGVPEAMLKGRSSRPGLPDDGRRYDDGSRYNDGRRHDNGRRRSRAVGVGRGRGEAANIANICKY